MGEDGSGRTWLEGRREGKSQRSSTDRRVCAISGERRSDLGHKGASFWRSTTLPRKRWELTMARLKLVLSIGSCC